MPIAPTTTRRALLAGTATTLAFPASAVSVWGRLPWEPNAGNPPRTAQPAGPGPWAFLTPEEGAALEAIVDRIIPPDPATPGGKDAGCAIYIDRQLAGPYGSSQGLYMRPPFMEGTKEQGNQSPGTPAQKYRKGLAAVDAACRAGNAGRPFRDLPAEAQDRFLHGLERGGMTLDGVNGVGFFELLLTDAKQGSFTDPVYGGNRDMAGWRMIGFPGARYDLSDWIGRPTTPRPPRPGRWPRWSRDRRRSWRTATCARSRFT